MMRQTLQIRENGLSFHVEAAAMGTEVRLKKAKVGATVHYMCPMCGSRCHFDLDDLKMAFMNKGEDKLWPVQSYRRIAEDTLELEKTRDFIEYLVKRAQIWQKHRDSYKRVRKSSQTSMELKCTNCGRAAVFNVSVEPTVSVTLPHYWLEPRGELFSSRQTEDLSEFFEVYDNDGFEHLERLAEARELMQALDTRNLSWEGHDKLVWKISWDRTAPDKPAPECAKEFVEKIMALRTDMEKAPIVASKLREFCEQTLVDAFKTEAVRYTSQSLASVFNSETFVDGLLRKLRRQLAEHLLWIHNQIHQLVAQGESVE